MLRCVRAGFVPATRRQVFATIKDLKGEKCPFVNLPNSQKATGVRDLMRADIAARNANFVGNATANRAALPQIQPSQRDDTGIYPPQEVQHRLEPIRARGNEASRIFTRIWTRFRAGQ